MKMWSLLLLAPIVSGLRILEQPEDVTVLQGDPATLNCRISEGEVHWFKDGLRIKLEAKKNVVLLPDGSLFFLTTRNSDTGLYHCGDKKERVVSHPAALIVGTEEEGIIPTVMDNEDMEDGISDISIEIQDIPADVSEKQEVVPLEVMTEQDLSSSVYIISMVVVAILTIIIILGAALIFNKIKKGNMALDTSQDRESTTPMMFATGPRTLDNGVNAVRIPHPHYNHYQYILQNEYDTPINVFQSDIYKCVSNSLEKTSSAPRKASSTSQKSSPTNSYHYASSNIIHTNRNNQPTAQYKMSNSAPRSAKDNFNYFSC